MVYIVLAICCHTVKLYGQQKKIFLDAINTGQKIPEDLWTVPFQLNNDPSGKKFATLNEFKGKLILIDFWTTYCKGCLESFPHSINLQKQFPEQVKILYVTPQSDSTIVAFFKNRPDFAKLGIVSVTSDSLFSQIFPHRIYPHVAWIGKNGKLLYETSASEVTQKNIESVLTDERTILQTAKNDILDIDFKQPLFYSRNGLENKILFRSILSPYIPGLPSRSGMERNDTTIRLYATNVNAVYLYKRALKLSDYQWPQSRIVFEGPTREALEVSNPSQYSSKTFCYELILPLAKQSQLFEIIANELTTFFRIRARIETKVTECYILSVFKTGLLPESRSDFSEQNLKDNDGKNKFLNNEWVTTLTDHLNTIKGMPPVIDSTGIDYKVDLKLCQNLSNIKSLNGALAKYGLILRAQTLELDMLVFSSNETKLSIK